MPDQNSEQKIVIDSRMIGEISPIKSLNIDCSTCSGNSKDCKELKQYKLCLENQFILWSPRFREYFCEGCQMNGSIGGYPYTNTENFPYQICFRHAEHCWRNHIFDPNVKMYVKRIKGGKVVRCDKNGNERPWKD